MRSFPPERPASENHLIKMASLLCRNCGKSQIGHILRQLTMMRSILKTFVENADLHQEEIVDTLIAAQVLHIHHVHLLSRNMESRHRMRKLWDLLLRVPSRKFKEHVEPLLEKLELLQDQAVVSLTTEMCLRCVMEQILCLEELADNLVTLGSLKVPEYRDAVKSGFSELDKWKVIFECLRKEHANQAVLNFVEQLLGEFEIPVPEGLPDILRNGVPCVCHLITDPVKHGQDVQHTPSTLLCHTCRQVSLAIRGPCKPKSSLPATPRLEHMFDEPDGEVEQEEEEVEIRPRSCRSLRRQRNAMAKRFQMTMLTTTTY